MTYRGLSVNYDARKDNKAGFSNVLWNSSLLYFVTTTLINLLNLSLYAVYGDSNATILCTMGIALTSMMSARVRECSLPITSFRLLTHRPAVLNLNDYVHRPMSIVHMSGIKSSHVSLPASIPTRSVSSYTAAPLSSSLHTVAKTNSSSMRRAHS